VVRCVLVAFLAGVLGDVLLRGECPRGFCRLATPRLRVFQCCKNMQLPEAHCALRCSNTVQTQCGASTWIVGGAGLPRCVALRSHVARTARGSAPCEFHRYFACLFAACTPAREEPHLFPTRAPYA